MVGGFLLFREHFLPGGAHHPTPGGRAGTSAVRVLVEGEPAWTESGQCLSSLLSGMKGQSLGNSEDSLG